MKSFKNSLSLLIEQLVNKQFPFAVYQYPGTGEVCVVTQTTMLSHVYDVKEVVNKPGFIIFPFDSAKTNEGFFINKELFACGNDEFDKLLSDIKRMPPNDVPQEVRPVPETKKSDYMRAAEYAVQKLKSDELDKVVLSRVKEKEVGAGFKVGDFYQRLTKKYPKAFVYLFSIPGTGTWIGATPETLLNRMPDGEMVVMALAGTAKSEVGKPVEWGQKEIEEQRYVSDYIKFRLSELGISSFVEEPTQTVIAGNIAHIRTIFRIAAGEADEVADLIKGLHPTPAVCGLPKVDAYRFIEQVEQHDRRFYTGYLGPWQLDGMSTLFVNLRCAEITNNRINLFVGGGLTAASNPEKEWQETELKATTLLSVFDDNE